MLIFKFLHGIRAVNASRSVKIVVAKKIVVCEKPKRGTVINSVNKPWLPVLE